jgi:hypothetical protein
MLESCYYDIWNEKVEENKLSSINVYLAYKKITFTNVVDLKILENTYTKWAERRIQLVRHSYESRVGGNRRMCVSTYCITNFVAPQPEGSSPHSQQPATGPCPEPNEPAPHPPANILKIHSDPSPHIRLSLPSGLFPSGLPHQNLVHFSLLPHACHMSRPLYSPLLDLPNDIWGWVQIMKLLIVQLSSFSRHLIPFWSRYSPQNPVLKHPQSMLFL